MARVLKTALAAWLVVSASPVVHAQAFNVIRRFGSLTNVTGFSPVARLVKAPDGTLYGTAPYGEGNAAGTLFKLSADGSEFQVMKWFTNSWEGHTPWGCLVRSGDVL